MTRRAGSCRPVTKIPAIPLDGRRRKPPDQSKTTGPSNLVAVAVFRGGVPRAGPERMTIREFRSSRSKVVACPSSRRDRPTPGKIAHPEMTEERYRATDPIFGSCGARGAVSAVICNGLQISRWSPGRRSPPQLEIVGGKRRVEPAGGPTAGSRPIGSCRRKFVRGSKTKGPGFDLE